MVKNENTVHKVAKVIPSRPGDERIGKEKHWYFPSPELKSNKMSHSCENPVNPIEEFMELIARNTKTLGFDEISSRILGFLFIETEEMSLEEIAIETGYSLSAVSTAMKHLSQYHILRRFTKPGSKRAFFILEKNMVSLNSQILRTRYENIFSHSKKELSEIIGKYELIESEDAEKEQEIAQQYYRQLLKLETIMQNTLEAMENVNED